MVENAPIRAASLPTYGYQIANAIAGSIITKDNRKVLPRESYTSLGTFSMPFVTPTWRSRT